MKKYSAIFLISTLIIVSCNKEKRFSKRLMNGETWIVNDIEVDATSLGVFGTWNITENVDIYDTVPRVLWQNGNEDAQFEWQFQDKGKTFQLNYVQLCTENEGTQLDNLDYTTFDLTGSYNVERHSSKKMEFISTSTLGYLGKKVVISLTRK